MLRRRASRRTRSTGLRRSVPLRVQHRRRLLLLRCTLMRPEVGLGGTRERVWRMTAAVAAAAREDDPTPTAGGRCRRTGTSKLSDADRRRMRRRGITDIGKRARRCRSRRGRVSPRLGFPNSSGAAGEGGCCTLSLLISLCTSAPRNRMQLDTNREGGTSARL